MWMAYYQNVATYGQKPTGISDAGWQDYWTGRIVTVCDGRPQLKASLGTDRSQAEAS
jgi:hypothetical protein